MPSPSDVAKRRSIDDRPAAVALPAGGPPPTGTLHEQVAAAYAELHATGGLPDQATATLQWRAIWSHDVHDSTSLAGNTAVCGEVERQLGWQSIIGTKALIKDLEARGYADAARWVYGQAAKGRALGQPLVTEAELYEIHRRAIGRLWDHAPAMVGGPTDPPGRWRSRGVLLERSQRLGVDSDAVPAEMWRWLAAANRFPTCGRPPLEEIALLHADFERIHPFIDGNGRTGRLAMNLILMRTGYPPAVVHRGDRDEYLDAVIDAQDAKPAALAELLARAVLASFRVFRT